LLHGARSWIWTVSISNTDRAGQPPQENAISHLYSTRVSDRRTSLFAAGYAAYFENALLRVAREAELKFADTDIEVAEDILYSPPRWK